jgi:lysophospholipid acyltransferase
MLSLLVFVADCESQELDSSQLATRITEFPNPLAFFGYVFYFPGILVGPTIEYNYYDQLVTGKLFPTKIGGKRVPQGRKRVAYQRLLTGLLFLGAFATFGGKLDYYRIMEPAFSQKSFLGRFVSDSSESGFTNIHRRRRR